MSLYPLHIVAATLRVEELAYYTAFHSTYHLPVHPDEKRIGRPTTLEPPALRHATVQLRAYRVAARPIWAAPAGRLIHRFREPTSCARFPRGCHVL
jgi:hypothetical protein